MKKILFGVFTAAMLLMGMTGCSSDDNNSSSVDINALEKNFIGLWWAEFEYADSTETGEPFNHVLLAVKADADHTGCIYLGVFDDSSDEPVAVYGGPEDAGFAWQLLPNGRVQIASPATGETKALTRADGGSYGSQTTDVASTQLTCAPEKLTMTNAGYSGTLVKANAEQAAAIEEKLKNFNTNGNGYEVIGIGEPNAPAGAKRYSGYDE
jgi:hypothetical protein